MPPLQLVYRGEIMAITVDVVRTVVDGEMGELQVTFKNDTNAAVNGLRLSVSDNGPVSPNALGSIGYLPSKSDGGYVVAGSVAANAEIVRTFAMKPIDAEAGKTFAANVAAEWTGGGPQTLAIQIFVEARPEVYAAIGAGERLRQAVLAAYDNFKDAGRQVHKDTALPDTKGEPASYALQPATFQWALGLIEQGTKLFKDQKKATGNLP